MSLRAAWRHRRPDFPWLDAADVDGVATFLAARGWLAPGERVVGCERAGDGNMNCTLRVHTDRRRVVVKQARPFVEKYDHIPAPWDRSTFERRFYERVASLPAVAAGMPRLLAADDDAHALLLEDLPGARDATHVYAGEPLDAATLGRLAAWLRALHDGTTAPADPAFANPAMRALNHEHCFVVPFTPDNGLDLDAYEPGLRARADALAHDAAVTARVAALGRRYLGAGTCLVHADFFPGSWLETAGGPRVIDPEFSFHGEPALDAGTAVAHLVLAGRPDAARAFLAAYGAHDAAAVAGWAAVEVLRRLLGVAQLPLPPSRGRRATLVARAAAALCAERLDPFWS